MREAAPERTIEISEVDLHGGSRKLRRAQVSGANSPGTEEQADPRKPDLIETMLERGNLIRALQAVERNAGAAGMDGMETSQLRRYLLEHWDRIKEQILNGSYEPRPVRRVDIPKAGGGTRMLGIPTVLDRFIQQAIHQALSPIWEPVFSAHSYGFRPGRSAQQAIKAAQRHVRSGKRWVVDLDLEKFFDRVNHDTLMARVARRVKDGRMLRLIRRYLESGIMLGGVIEQRVEGTPQGGPLSPLLSNILLDDLDKELERRGHRFCRYADDCNLYVGSRRAGERVMESLTRFLGEKLKLTVNRLKSAVERPWKRKFLGYSLTAEKESRVRVAPQSVERFKDKMREKFREGRGRNLRKFLEGLKPLLRGWAGYFSVAQTRGVFEELDQWIRRKLRCMEWRKWKRGRTRRKRLIALGLDENVARTSAFNGHGPWWNAGASHLNLALPTAYFRRLGLLLLIEEVVRQTALRSSEVFVNRRDTEPYRPVVWEDGEVLTLTSYPMCARWVVGMDLEKVFDRVNHDALMARVARVTDERMLRLIRRYLESGIMLGGVIEQRVEGTPQGGPLSPLLSNILLDDLDKELEKRGHRFCRYADDCNIYVGSRRAGERVMQSLTTFLREKLKLTVNQLKSAVDRPWKRKFLGFSLTAEKESRVRVAPQSVERFKDKLREKFREGRGRNLRKFLEELKPLLRGWASYFSAQTRGVFEGLDQWIRRKLRCLEWRKWKRGRTRRKRLIALGLEGSVAQASAFNGHGPWWNAGASHMNLALPTAYFRRLGLLLLVEEVVRQTALRAAKSL